MLRYAWQARPGLTCFVVFRPIESEAFDAYVGWSLDGRCPYALPQLPEAVSTYVGERAMQPSMHFVPRHGTAHWNFWEPAEEVADNPAEYARSFAAHFMTELSYEDARALVSPAVEQGVDEIVRFGLPYLVKRAGVA